MACVSERTALASADAPEDDDAPGFNWDSLAAQMRDHDCTTQSQIADKLGMHHSAISRVRRGLSKPSRKLIKRVTSLGIPYASVFTDPPRGSH